MRKSVRVSHLIIFCLILVFLAISSPSTLCQEKAKVKNEIVLDSGLKTEVIRRINKLFVEKYIFLETAEKMKAHLESNLAKGEYDAVDSVYEFARILTKDLRSVSNDKHIRVAYDPDLVQRIRDSEGQSEEDRRKAEIERLERERRGNFGYQKLEILEGNIGYLDLRYFSGARESGPTATAAMNFLANADAVIIDLRKNGGGDPATIQFISSYFLKDYTHLNSFENRGEDSLQQFWTLPYVPGKSMYDTDLYILTSRRTFSAAEEFTYNMKNLKRATLVGETTGGGAHPGGFQIVDDNFLAWIPTGRAVNPITKTNWEGTGIKPHIEVPQDQALKTSHQTALQKLVEKAGDEVKKQELNWQLEALRAVTNPVKVEEAVLKRYIGRYTQGEVILEHGHLFLLSGAIKAELLPLSDTRFALEGESGVRLEFSLDETGKTYQAILHFQNGQEDVMKRIQ